MKFSMIMVHRSEVNLFGCVKCIQHLANDFHQSSELDARVNKDFATQSFGLNRLPKQT